MLLLGLRLDNDLKLEFENNFENDLVFVENMISFMDAIKNRKYEAIVIDERNSKEEALISLITKITELQKKVVIIILGAASNWRVIAGSIKAGAYDFIDYKVEGNTVYLSLIAPTIDTYQYTVKATYKPNYKTVHL